MQAASRSSAREASLLRNLAVAAGLGWSLAFVIVALVYELQLYADGAMFSYAVAVQDVWAFHWHNIANRVSVFFLSLWPAEALVGLTGSPAAGITTYGFLFYVVPLIGLLGTLAADRSRGRIFFAYGCASTALLCPLIFGFPTEMWTAHALFWPALALAHYARRGILRTVILSVTMTTLALTHAGGVVFAFVIVATLALRGFRHPLFVRGAVALVVAMALWVIVKMAYPPDDYFADVLVRAGLHFFDPAIFQVNLIVLLFVVLGCYCLLFLALCRIMAVKTALFAALAVSATALLIYWLQFDQWVHASNRYYLRTALVVITPAFGALSAVYAMRADGAPVDCPHLLQIAKFLASVTVIRACTGAIILCTAIHVVQTAKFVTDWTAYKAAVRALALGSASDPVLGDPRFVSSQRISPELNQLSWFSTVEYLSIILSDFKPVQIVVDPAGNYFWLSCGTATENAKATRSVPMPARDLVRIYSCLHR
ncbi:MAG TPA: hypothetical protein VFP43_12535 [Mesorhizobium sp.]|nr:hypothetical protein [Mesorhizobium sp.]